MDNFGQELLQTNKPAESIVETGTEKVDDMQNALDAYGFGQSVPIGINESTFADIDVKLKKGTPIETIADETAAELRQAYTEYQKNQTVQNIQTLTQMRLVARAVHLRQSGFEGKSIKLQEMRALLHQLLKDKIPVESIVNQIGEMRSENERRIHIKKAAEDKHDLEIVRKSLAAEAKNPEEKLNYLLISPEAPEGKNIQPDTYVVKKSEDIWMTAHDLIPEQANLVNSLIPNENGRYLFRKNGDSEIFTAYDRNELPVFTLEKVGEGASRAAYRITYVNELDKDNYGATWVMVGDASSLDGGQGVYAIPEVTKNVCNRPIYLEDGTVLNMTGPYYYIAEITDNITVLPSNTGGVLEAVNLPLSVLTPQLYLGALALSIEKNSMARQGYEVDELHNINFMIRNRPPGVPVPRMVWKEVRGKRVLIPGIVYVNMFATEFSMR